MIIIIGALIPHGVPPVLMLIIGAIVVTVAKTQDYLLAGRFVLGFGVSITTTAAPAYVVEMSPPQWRGRLTGL